MAIRSFIALETPSHVRKAIADVQARLATANADVRWESYEKLHVTIKFLGNVDAKTMPQVLSTIEHATIDLHPFEVTYTHLGCFPTLSQPRVIWLGCENPDGALSTLKRNLDSGLKNLGFDMENREFRPHVTVGRVRSQRGIHSLIPMLESITFAQDSIPCNEIVLMKSLLKQQGSEYSIIQRFVLS